jgi:Na+/citrate or Na+/malate symporter
MRLRHLVARIHHSGGKSSNEDSTTTGLVMADTGGRGDVSVLSAAGRMHLMPFAALTNRIGGAWCCS